VIDTGRVHRRPNKLIGATATVSLRAYLSDGTRFYFWDTFGLEEVLKPETLLDVCLELHHEYQDFRRRPFALSELKNNNPPPEHRFFVQTGPDEHTELLPADPDLFGSLKCNNDGWCTELNRYV
jgi:hypothetical protein